MPASNQRRFALREFAGVNLMINARVLSPGSWRKLANLYMPSPGRLEQVPGTVQHAQKIVLGEVSPTGGGNWPDDFPGGTGGQSSAVTQEEYKPETVRIGKFTDASNPDVQIAAVGTVGGGGKTYVAPTAGTTIFDASF